MKKEKGSDDMDFSKFNNEFMNMQTMIVKYNNQVNEIKNRIKYNLKEIGKYDTKIKGSKNIVEKSLYKTMIETIKQENKFLESLVESEVEKNEKTDSKN
ncbi:MAG: hypothetical protein IJY25_04020 [Bacilli bacterium]|nr:hypothetical protein [Bacilli bacterium]MBQ9072301.1 hypothetical protein [Bacilli bacterium]